MNSFELLPGFGNENKSKVKEVNYLKDIRNIKDNGIDNNTFDLIIVGAGPAGLTAGIYAGRFLLKTLIIGETKGGTISDAIEVCNFPTYPSITGMKLSSLMLNHVSSVDVRIKEEKVVEILNDDVNKRFEVKTTVSTYFSKKIILATGRKKRKLNFKEEDRLLGKGISYCATCDGAFYKDKIVGVVGGGDAALTSALLLSQYAKKVYIFYRKQRFTKAEPAWIKKVEENDKIEPVFNVNIKEIIGNEKLESVVLDNDKELKLDGLFIEIGFTPTEIFSKQLGLKTEDGYIVVDKNQRTNVPGVFAAGDITNNSLKQVIVACGEGAIAANSAFEEIKKDEEN